MKNISLETIKSKIKNDKSFLEYKFKVKALELFGSFVRGENTPNSDLDILVDFKEDIDLFTFVELEDYLSNLLGVKVDLVSKRALKPGIKENVLKEAIQV
ncbi:MAG: nucleotidyltransferase family protein [Caldisericum sp.]|uniref:nucleotidyltransferase family protein n=1 Tax=Caldisericum sp. TaxID=2499687 RepID=UPI003D0D805B